MSYSTDDRDHQGIPDDDNNITISMNSISECSDKWRESYLFRLCVAQCAKSCLTMNFNIAPSTYVSIFTYGPLLLDLLKEAVKDSDVVSEYQSIVTTRLIQLNGMYKELKNGLIKTNEEDQTISKTVQNRMDDVVTIYNNINENIYDAEYLYKHRVNGTISLIINSILRYVIYNDKYKNTIVKLIEKHYGKQLTLFRGNAIVNKIKKIGTELSLNDDCCRFMLLLYTFYRRVSTANGVLANILGLNKKQFSTCANKLLKLGLIEEAQDNIMEFDLSSIVSSYVCNHSTNSFSEYLLDTYKSNNKIKLTINDYPENIQDKIKYIIKLIDNHDGKTPCNILLYGKSGSGKSSLIDYLQDVIKSKSFCPITVENIKRFQQHATYSTCGEVERPVDPHPEFDDYEVEDKNSARERLSYLKLCDNLPTHDNYVFVVDECDDSINNPQSDYECWLTGKKQLNELLENIKTPTIWIANHINKLDESTCRRFSYSIKFDDLNFKQRAKIWTNQINYTHTEKYMKNIDVEQLALTYKISAGLINSILQSIKTINPPIHDVSKIIKDFAISHCDLIGTDYNYTDNRKAEHSVYSIEGLNIKSKTSLNDIKEGLMLFYKQLLDKSNKNRNINILLDGPPGTGKTEYAKYIARYLDAPLITCHGSDFLSKWVGETEQIIKQTFNEAEQTKSVLFIDEADGLIHQRSNSHNNWEITQVNEFLCQMERFNGILICATNFLKNMDNASIRRFSFKVTFDYLNNEGKLIFFKRFFNDFGEFDYRYVETKLKEINNLVPGDFKIVRDRCNFLYNGKVDCEIILQQLTEELNYKSGVEKNKPIGFC